jgi:hypothetical protein
MVLDDAIFDGIIFFLHNYKNSYFFETIIVILRYID